MQIEAGALLFDLDGLMVDSEPLWFEINCDLVKERGRPPAAWTHAHAEACIGQGIPSLLRYMETSFGFPVDIEKDAAQIVETYIARVQKLELKAGFQDLVDAARAAGVPIAVASSNKGRVVDAVLARFALTEVFDAVVSGDHISRPKPAPDIFLEAARRVGVAPERCVVLEDSVAGATAGFAANMKVIAVPEGSPEGRGFEAVAHAIVPSLVEARPLLVLTSPGGASRR